MAQDKCVPHPVPHPAPPKTVFELLNEIEVIAEKFYDSKVRLDFIADSISGSVPPGVGMATDSANNPTHFDVVSILEARIRELTRLDDQISATLTRIEKVIPRI